MDRQIVRDGKEIKITYYLTEEELAIIKEIEEKGFIDIESKDETPKEKLCDQLVKAGILSYNWHATYIKGWVSDSEREK